MTLRTLPTLWLVSVVVAAFTAMAPGPAQSQEWEKVDGLSYLEMPDKMFDRFYRSLSWCRASVETPEKRLDEFRTGFSEEEAQRLLKSNQEGCLLGASERMRNAGAYGYVGEKEAVFDPAFWARLDEARENLK